MTAFVMNNINKQSRYAESYDNFKEMHTTNITNNNDKNMLFLLQQGMSIDLKSDSYEDISEEIWNLVDDLTDGVEVDLD